MNECYQEDVHIFLDENLILSKISEGTDAVIGVWN